VKNLYHKATGKYKEKFDVQNHPAKYWGTLSLYGKRIVHRSDGAISVDKTIGVNSRPTKKQQLRNANRSMTKSARQLLKKEIREELDIY